jgi:hypothetical protein
VGRAPSPAADALVGLAEFIRKLNLSADRRVQGDPRRPGKM